MEVIHANRMRCQRGAALMALIVVLCISGMALMAWGESKSKSQNLAQQIELSTLQELKHIKSSLYAHAVLKGHNSLTHPGSVPCPSNTPNGTTPASCLNAWLGFLPIQSRSAVNHLRLAVNSKPNGKLLGGDKSWRYAVSPQLIQANELGWSQWVDWTQPSLSVWHEGAITTNVAVVVAEGIELIDEHTVKAWGAHTFILTAELKREILKAQEAAVYNTLNAWLNQNQEIFSHENLNWNIELHIAQAKWSDCQCNCTRTRCNCSCNEDSWWVSESACLLETETCKPFQAWDKAIPPKGKPLSHLCNSKGGNSCIFKGSSRLLSDWPVSTTLPVAAKGKACEKFTSGSCPLSTGNSSCVCDFNWPSNSKAYLSAMSLNVISTGNAPTQQAEQ